MLRFTLHCKYKYDTSDAEYERLYSIDVEVPEVERALEGEEYGENGYSITELVDVEFLRKENE